MRAPQSPPRRSRFSRRAAAALTASAALAAGGCGGGIPLVTPPPVEHLPTGCVIADVSGSALRARGAYREEFNRLARDVAERNGRICLLMASGNPLAEARLHLADLKPEHVHNSLLRPKEIDRNVALVAGQFDYLLEHPGVGARGSGLVEAAAMAARGLEPEGELVFLSDAVQVSQLLDVHDADLSDAGIQAILDDFDEQRLLPDLTGVSVRFPLPFFHPPGSLESRRPPSESQIELRARIHAFWEAWAVRVNADQPLGWGT
jgi:hypothetical protein